MLKVHKFPAALLPLASQLVSACEAQLEANQAAIKAAEQNLRDPNCSLIPSEIELNFVRTRPGAPKGMLDVDVLTMLQMCSRYAADIVTIFNT